MALTKPIQSSFQMLMWIARTWVLRAYFQCMEMCLKFYQLHKTSTHKSWLTMLIKAYHPLLDVAPFSIQTIIFLQTEKGKTEFRWGRQTLNTWSCIASAHRFTHADFMAVPVTASIGCHVWCSRCPEKLPSTGTGAFSRTVWPLHSSLLLSSVKENQPAPQGKEQRA